MENFRHRNRKEKPRRIAPAGSIPVEKRQQLFAVDAFVSGFDQVIARIRVQSMGFTLDRRQRIVADCCFGALRQFGGMLLGSRFRRDQRFLQLAV